MAYCPKCRGNYQIVVRYTTEFSSEHTKFDRYDSEDRYIGSEEGFIPVTKVESFPCCSNCYSVLQYPQITSEKDYFYLLKNKMLNKYLEILDRYSKIKPPTKSDCLGNGIGMGLIVGFLPGLLLGYLIQALTDTDPDSITALFITIVIGLVISWIISSIICIHINLKELPEKFKSYEKSRSEMSRLESKMNELKSLEYSPINLDRLYDFDLFLKNINT
ncbi:MAG: hypothetical protein QW279_05530 [Candidatus Jordarchaeaceae archaeon]